MKIDLHNHSTYSDGLYDVDGLLKYAKENNIKIMALTDHDTIDGVSEAMLKSKAYGIKVIPGIELTTEYKNEPVHIIGLFKNNIVPNSVQEYSSYMKKLRKDRAIQMLEGIKEIYKINVDFSLAKDMNVITRGNLLQIILKSNPSIDEASALKYVSKDSKAYIGIKRFNVSEGLNYLKENNCITILAHPTLIKQENLEEVLAYPFDGIEARYPKNKLGEEEVFTNIAISRNMFISAGSDFHGDISHADIGTCVLSIEEYEKIKKKLEE